MQHDDWLDVHDHGDDFGDDFDELFAEDTSDDDTAAELFEPEPAEYWDEFDTSDAPLAEAEVDAAPAAASDPGPLRFGATTGSYGKVDEAVFSDDGYVYDQGGNCLGTH